MSFQPQVTCVGAGGCGKTNLLRALVGLPFDPSSPPTAERTAYQGGGRISYVDCGVIEDANGLRDLNARASGVLIAFDMTNRESFESIKNVWLSSVLDGLDFPEQVQVYLVGCKSDLGQEHRVSREELESFADVSGNLLSICTSSRTGANIGVLRRMLESSVHGASSGLNSSYTALPQPSPMMKIYRTGSVDYSSQASGLNLHLNSQGQLQQHSGFDNLALTRSQSMARFPVLIDISTSSGLLGDIEVNSPNDDPVALAEAFLLRHGQDPSKKYSLGRVVQARLEEFTRYNVAARPMQPVTQIPYQPNLTNGLYPQQQGSYTPIKFNSPSTPYSMYDAESAIPRVIPRGQVNSSFTGSLMNDSRVSSSFHSQAPEEPSIIPRQPRNMTNRLGSRGILGRCTVNLSDGRSTVVVVRNGDHPQRVVQAFCSTYGLNMSNPQVQKLSHEVYQLLGAPVPVQATPNPIEPPREANTSFEEELEQPIASHRKSKRAPVVEEELEQPIASHRKSKRAPVVEQNQEQERDQEQISEEPMEDEAPPPPPPSKYDSKPKPKPARDLSRPRISETRSRLARNSTPASTPAPPPSAARKPLSSGSHSRTQSKTGVLRNRGRVLFYVDVKIGGKSERCAVCKDDNLREVAENFLDEHGIAKTQTIKLVQLLEHRLRLHNKSQRSFG